MRSSRLRSRPVVTPYKATCSADPVARATVLTSYTTGACSHDRDAHTPAVRLQLAAARPARLPHPPPPPPFDYNVLPDAQPARARPWLPVASVAAVLVVVAAALFLA